MTSCLNHPGRPARTGSLCGSCYNRALREASPEEHAKGKERRSLALKARRSADPAAWATKQRNRVLKYRYGISSSEYEAMFTAQRGCCAICERPSGEGMARMYVDHDHSTDAVRGLLCAGCNTCVGILETREGSVLEKMLEYMRDHGSESLQTLRGALAGLEARNA